jgi:hypothetical protein
MDQLVVLFLCMDQLFVASLDAFRMTLALLHTGRKKAPCVSQDALVGALMGALISDLEKAYKGEQCIQGITEFLRNGKVERNTLQNNKVLIRSLLSINQQCIFKRSDIKAALLDVDCRVQYRVSNGYKCSTWADDWASFSMRASWKPRNASGIARTLQGFLHGLLSCLPSSRKVMWTRMAVLGLKAARLVPPGHLGPPP